jgi:hypothetical protein
MEVFAARGLGVNASAGSGIGNDQVEDFTRPSAGPNCVADISLRMMMFMYIPTLQMDSLIFALSNFIGK